MSETVEAYLVNLHTWALYTLYGDKMLFLFQPLAHPPWLLWTWAWNALFAVLKSLLAVINGRLPEISSFFRKYYVGTSVDYVNISFKKSVQLYFERKNKFKGGVFRRVFRNDPSTISWSYNLFSINFET